MNDLFDSLLDQFLEEASGQLNAVESSLLLFERELGAGRQDRNLITLLLGSLHTLKGGAGMMGLDGLQHYVHTQEDLLKRVAEGTLAPSPTLVESLLGAVSSMRDRLGSLGGATPGSLDFSDEITLLNALFAESDAAAVEPLLDPPPADPGREDEAEYLTRSSGTVKVSFDKLDDLLNLVGELVIQRTALAELTGKLKQELTNRPLLQAFNSADEMIGKTAGELRDAIMKVRMLPVGTVFSRFERLVRDLSRRHGKEVRLVFRGEDTDLDKTVIDRLGEPLLHLIRNAVDHGIEPPGVRSAAGKPRMGTVILSAAHENNHIVVRIEDDGCGISIPALKEAARRKGVLDPREAAILGDQEALQLLFAPGFSTTTEVTETSGRGIGLDVVKKTVLSLNGTTDVASTPGRGTCFTVQLPLTLAIISALLVQVAGETFAVPLSTVLESVRVTGDDIHQVPSGDIVRLRDRLLPVIRLEDELGLQGGGRELTEYVVVVGSGEKRGGIAVERLMGQQEIVIRGMDDYLGELPGISGATVLGSGKVSLILDVPGLLERQRKGAGNVRQQ